MSFTDGPYITAACFCDLVLEDKSGVLSLIRIVDTVIHAAVGPMPPKDLQPFGYTTNLVLMLKSGMAHGRYDLRIVPNMPDGSTGDAITVTCHLEGEEKGQNIVGQIAHQFTMEGLHWFKVYLEEDLLTAIPLRVRYDRVVTAAPRLPG
jgi:hypothetical protein